MSAQTDFQLTLDRAANSVLDASCAARAAGAGPLPHPHRRLLNVAITALEKAQDALFKARNDPWSAPRNPAPRQLELL
jgi:hypothetical protein